MAILDVEHRGPVAWVTLNRPEKLNAINDELVDKLLETLDTLARDDDLLAMVVTGSGDAFSAGFDLAEDPGEHNADSDSWHRILRRDVAVTMALWEFPLPTIAAVKGWCLAGGCELAMACDIVVASEDARFGEPEIRYGSGPTTLLMPFILGQKKTNELLYTGDTLNATDAERLGLINRVVPLNELERSVTELASRIALTPSKVLRLTKLAIKRAYEAKGLREAVNANLDLSAILNSAAVPEREAFNEIVRTKGLRESLAWRDGRYGSPL